MQSNNQNLEHQKQVQNGDDENIDHHGIQNEEVQKQEQLEQYDALGLSIIQNQEKQSQQIILQQQQNNTLQEQSEQKENPQQYQPNNENLSSSQNQQNNHEQSQTNTNTILNKKHSLISKSLHQQEQSEKLHEDQIKQNQNFFQRKEQQHEHINNLDHTQLIKLDEHQNVILQPTMQKSTQSIGNQKKFERYLNQQIYKIGLGGLGQMPNDMSPKFTAGSPISLPYNFSLRSIDSSFYRPQNHSLNFSRSYIPNFVSLGNPTIYQFSPIDSKEGVEKKLRYIFDYYAQTYLQPTKKYQTFDAVGKRVMKFQSFILFAKDFKLLKTIFKLDTIKKVYKKQSQFGKILQFSNFINLIEALSHEKQCNSYFKLQETVPGMNSETKASLQIRELHAYMGLYENIEKLKQKFSKIFLPFNCEKEAQLPKIKFKYRQLSLHDLHKKALPELRDTKSIKSRITIKSTQKLNHSPFDNEKQLLVSWQMLRSKSLKNVDAIKHSTIKLKKLIKQDPQDKIYLNEYRQVKSVPRYMIEQKIKEINKIEDKKSHRMLQNLQRIDDKILQSKLNLQKKLSRNKL